MHLHMYRGKLYTYIYTEVSYTNVGNFNLVLSKQYGMYKGVRKERLLATMLLFGGRKGGGGGAGRCLLSTHVYAFLGFIYVNGRQRHKE